MAKNTEEFTNIKSLVNCLASAMDLTSPSMREYYQRITYMSCQLAIEAGYQDAQLSALVGRLLFNSIRQILKEANYSMRDVRLNAKNLSELGTTLFKFLPESKPVKANLSERLIALSEEIVRKMDDTTPPLEYARNFTPEKKPVPDVEKILDEVRKKDYVWMNLFYTTNLFSYLIKHNTSVSLDDTIKLTEAISFLIDFRSPFTAMHSAGVAASAVELAKYAGMNATEQKMMQIAGNMHDLGKLKVPTEILEKNGKLTDEEFNVIKEHAFYTYQILRKVDGFDEIAEWAGYHHEKLNGRGYPFGLSEDQIPLGTRIMTVADIFSAITEVRPYRKGMNREKVIEIMNENVERGEISKYLVEILISHYDDIDAVRENASREAGKRYFDAIEENEEQIQKEAEAAIREAKKKAEAQRRAEAKRLAEEAARAKELAKKKDGEKGVVKQTAKVVTNTGKKAIGTGKKTIDNRRKKK